jgi:hypothetical protein
MKWTKALLVGAAGSLIMVIIMFFGIGASGLAPFSRTPSAAFLTTIGLNVGPLPLLLHFGYGAGGSALLVYWAGREVTLAKGLGLAGGLWLLMMLVHSPLIGWGVFGTAAGTGSPDDPLYLESTGRYIGMTFVLHAIYGAVIGWGNAAWTVPTTDAAAFDGSEAANA